MNDQNNTGIGNQVPNPNNMMGGVQNPNNNVMMGATPNPNNNVMMGATPNPNTPKKNNTTIIIIAVIAVVVIGVILFFVLKKPNSNKIHNTEDIVKESIKLEKNITVTDQKLDNGNILLKIKNKNKDIIFADTTVDFYDKNNNLVNSEMSIIAPISSNQERYDSVYLDRNIKYDRYEIKTKVYKANYYEIVDPKKIEIKSTINKENIEMLLQVKNNYGKTINDVWIDLLFYKGDKIVGHSVSNVKDFRVDETVAKSAYIPNPSYNNKLNYDRVEFLVNASNVNYKKK